MEELRTHERKEFVVTVGEAGQYTNVFDDVADDERDASEHQDAAETIVLRAVNEGEGEGGENLPGNDGSGGSAEGEDLKDAGEQVAGDQGGEGNGYCAILQRRGEAIGREDSSGHNGFHATSTRGLLRS